VSARPPEPAALLALLAELEAEHAAADARAGDKADRKAFEVRRVFARRLRAALGLPAGGGER
jgi:hypothetical protein